MSFDENGYLSTDAMQWGNEYTLQHRDYFDYFASVNRMSHDLLKVAEFDCTDGPLYRRSFCALVNGISVGSPLSRARYC
jgi:hypothetical protein